MEEKIINLQNYLSGREYNSQTIHGDIDYFFNNVSAISKNYPTICENIYNNIADKINEYKIKCSVYVHALIGGPCFDDITSLYHSNLSYPFRDNKNDLHIFKRLFKQDDSYVVIAYILKLKVFGYTQLIDNPYEVGNIDELPETMDEIDAIVGPNSKQFYYNPDRKKYTDEECEKMLDEIYSREADGLDSAFYELNDKELIGKYGEYKVKKYFEKFNYIIDQVSNYGDGYGFDIALVEKDLSQVIGIEVKSTINDYDEDTIILSDTQFEHFNASNEVKNFYAIRYSIPEDKLYLIAKGKDGFYCVDQDGNQHKVSNYNTSFTITKTRPKDKGGR